MAQALLFGEVLDAAERLSMEEQEQLVSILHRRLVLSRRRHLADDIQAAREEFAAGQCQPTTVDELMREIQA